MQVFISRWGWSKDKMGKVSPDEKQAIIDYCKHFGELPPMHKNVRRHWQAQAERHGWLDVATEAEIQAS